MKLYMFLLFLFKMNSGLIRIYKTQQIVWNMVWDQLNDIE